MEYLVRSPVWVCNHGKIFLLRPRVSNPLRNKHVDPSGEEQPEIG